MATIKRLPVLQYSADYIFKCISIGITEPILAALQMEYRWAGAMGGVLLRKHAYLNILKNIPPKNEIFIVEKLWYCFIFLLKT